MGPWYCMSARMFVHSWEHQVSLRKLSSTNGQSWAYWHLTSGITVDEVANEVHSVFKKPMGYRNDYPFQYLQPTGTDIRCLTVPAVSSAFAWMAKQVACLGMSTGTIYIIYYCQGQIWILMKKKRYIECNHSNCMINIFIHRVEILMMTCHAG